MTSTTLPAWLETLASSWDGCMHDAPGEMIDIGASIRAAAAKAAPCLLQIAEPAEPSPTAGMNIAQRILHVGGRDNAAGYIEFGSIQAVEALVRQVLRDLPSAPQAALAAVPLPLLVRDIARELGITVPQACIALKPLGNYSTYSAVTAEMAGMLRDHFPGPAPMPVAHPHHCTARTAEGSCEECEGHAQAMAEWNAERAALAATPAAPAKHPQMLVDAGALQMVVNALRRDAEEGKKARGEMADELLATATQAAGVPAAEPDALRLLGKDHTGMRVDYSGLLGQVQREIDRSAPGHAEMIRQLKGHMEELGQGWYAGNTAVVDEFLQLYCVEREARAAIAAQAAAKGV